MIPALFAIPMAEGVVGQVLNTFAPVSTSAGPVAQPAFSTALNQATTTAASIGVPTSTIGTLRVDQWGQMSGSDLSLWAKGLSGRHVDVTDASGRTISGTVNGVQASGNSFDLNIGGHLVSLSSLKQISWSPSI